MTKKTVDDSDWINQTALLAEVRVLGQLVKDLARRIEAARWLSLGLGHPEIGIHQPLARIVAPRATAS
jgi:hypothetical protein